jgi:hypothetical protein
MKLSHDWRSVGQSVLLSGCHLELTIRFFSVLTTAGGTPSLARGWICNVLVHCFWALPEQSLLGRSPTELTPIFHSLICDSPNLKGQISVFTSPRKRVAELYPRALGSLYVASYYSQGLRWRYSNPPPLEHNIWNNKLLETVFYVQSDLGLYSDLSSAMYESIS